VVAEAEADDLVSAADSIKPPPGFKKTVHDGAWTTKGLKRTKGKLVSFMSDKVQVHVNLAKSDGTVEAIGNTLFKDQDGWALMRGRGANESFYTMALDDLDYLIKKQVSMATKAMGEGAPTHGTLTERLEGIKVLHRGVKL
jgi:hypothetical protein